MLAKEGEMWCEREEQGLARSREEGIMALVSQVVCDQGAEVRLMGD